ncbi:MAG: hypothetical protein AB7O43_17705 [Hyphomicrobiaceae bacterium]
MASFVKFQPFIEGAFEGTFNLGSDTLKIALTNTAPNATDSQLSEITQIANGNGYTAGGATVTVSSSAQSGGTYKLVGADVVFTATGAMGPFQYAVLYDDDAANDELIGYWDYGGAVTLANTDTFTVDFDGSNGILQAA